MPRLLLQIVVLLAAGASVYAQTSPTVAPACDEYKTRAERAEGRLKDWPALSRYANDNSKLTPSVKNEQRVVFMGDSITDSWDSPAYGGFFRASLT